MSTSEIRVRVDDGSFCLSDRGEIAPETLDFSNGLIATMNIGAMIPTGIHTGDVKVRATAATGPPTTSDVTEWDEVIEASVHAPHGELRVETLYSGPPAQFPLLSQAGPGWYRLRAYARGRDIARDAVQDDSAEQYYLVCWPAPQTTPLIIRATDLTGRGLRTGAVKQIATPAPPEPATDPGQQQEDPIRRNLLKAARRKP
ncbi:hypothetical protein ABZW18_30295 [Streptomyces sp. NPDC004647]|uniref:hypothetical protein n=1 Tax=Streptomyces sp. NPDC004647 TaxID=3154671 RepID=UPI0033A86A1F